MNSHVRQLHHALRRMAGGCALLLYVASSPLGLGLASLVGSFDRDHRVCFRLAGASLQVVLRHPSDCRRHQHRGVARALTLFAQPARPGEPDHVLQLAVPDPLTRTTQLAAPERAIQATFAGAPVGVEPLLSRQHSSPSVAPRPPPDCDGLLLQLRSTLLRV